MAIDGQGNPVFLREIWPSREEIRKIEETIIRPEIFIQTYEKVGLGTERWNSLNVKESVHFEWKKDSTYIHDPPFFKPVQKDLPKLEPIRDAYSLAVFGDSITTDHISPAGNISGASPAARFLKERGI